MFINSLVNKQPNEMRALATGVDKFYLSIEFASFSQEKVKRSFFYKGTL